MSRGKRGHPNLKKAFSPGRRNNHPFERIGWGLQVTGLLPALGRARSLVLETEVVYILMNSLIAEALVCGLNWGFT